MFLYYSFHFRGVIGPYLRDFEKILFGTEGMRNGEEIKGERVVPEKTPTQSHFSKNPLNVLI